MCGPRYLFFQCGPETSKGWTPLLPLPLRFWAKLLPSITSLYSTTWPPLAGGPFVPQTQLAPNSSSCQISFLLLLTPSNGPIICLKSQARSLGVTSTPPSPSPPPHSPVSYLILLILFPKYFSNPNICLHLLFHPIPSFSSGFYTSNFDLASDTLPLQSRQ